jgi:hypothetical protein
MYVYKSVPTITLNNLPNSVLAGGTVVLQAFQISSGGTGTIGWQHLVFTYATSQASSTLASPQLWDADASSQITGSSSINGASKQIVFDASAEQQITGGKNYQLKATYGGTVSTGDYITTQILNPLTSFSQPVAATTASSTGVGLGVSFTWSDLSLVSHGFTTLDWNNDFLVKNLPTNTQILTK